MQLCKMFIGKSDYKVFFLKKVYGVCRNTLIIKTAITYFVICFPKYSISNINGFPSQG